MVFIADLFKHNSHIQSIYEIFDILPLPEWILVQWL